jgi:hypothetical protein
MSLLELFFLLAVLVSGITLTVVVVLAFRGRRRHALTLLGIFGICVVSYLVAGVLISFAAPQRVLRVGEPWCFDDWCLSVEQVSRAPGPVENSYLVSLRIFSRARRATQRAKGAWIYLIDDRGHLYPPDPDPSAVPLDHMLQPGESIPASRVFHVPANVHRLGLVTGDGGSYCGPMNFLIIGQGGCLFGKPAMLRIQ